MAVCVAAVLGAFVAVKTFGDRRLPVPLREQVRAWGWTRPDRADIVDRDGTLLAWSSWTPSIYADDSRDRANSQAVIDALAPVLGIADNQARVDLMRRFSSAQPFVWLKRRAKDEMVAAASRLGAAGLAVKQEPGRSYPTPAIAPHVLGIVNIDGQGIAGLELGMERRLAGARTPLVTSLNARLQASVAGRLDDWIDRTGSRAGVVIVQKPDTGEILAMVSKPDFDPADPTGILDRDRMNRSTGGVFQARQLNQLFALAQLMESDPSPNRTFKRGTGAKANDTTAGSGAEITLAELFAGGPGEDLARAAMEIGDSRLRQFYGRLRLLDALALEIPETATSLQRRTSNVWADERSRNGWRPQAADKEEPTPATDSAIAETSQREPEPQRGPDILEPETSILPLASGEGLAATPLAMLSAIGGLLNGGVYVPPTLLKRSPEDARPPSVNVLSARASRQLGEFFADQAGKDPGLRELAERYHLGLKTSVDHLVINGRYVADRKRLSGVAAIPAQSPRLVLYVLLDDPKTDASVSLLAGGIVKDITAAGAFP